GVLAALTITPAFFFAICSLGTIIFRNRIEHKTATFFVRENPAFTAHTFGYQDSHHTRRPDHSGGMKLHELHVDQFRASVISQRVAVAGVFPTVARDFVSAP